MRTATENTQEILTSPQARKIIDYISPIYNDGPIALSILNAIGTELDDLEEWAQQLWREINPLTATWSLKYWELNYGLPVNGGMSLDQRRGRLLAKINARAPTNPFRVESMAKSVCQREVEVVENTGYRKFDVNIQPGTNNFNYSVVLDAVKKAKPSRLYFDLLVVVRENLTNGIKLINYIYNHPVCNQFDCGELPMAGTIGKITNTNISLINSVIKSAYNIEACGTFPDIGTVGIIVNQVIDLDDNTVSGLNNKIPCGTLPIPGTVGLAIDAPIGASIICNGAQIEYDICNALIASGTVGRLITSSVGLPNTVEQTTHGFNMCGALIAAGSQGLAAVMNAMALSNNVAQTAHDLDICGTLKASGTIGLSIGNLMALPLIRTTNPVNYALCGDLTCGA